MDPRLERLRTALVRRADVFEDPGTYRAGVEDAIAAIDGLLAIDLRDVDGAAQRDGWARLASDDHDDLVVSA